MSKKVLILSEPFGTGHTKAAEALTQGIFHLAPSIRTQILELSQKLHPVTTTLMFHSYIKIIIKFPALWRRIYQYKQNKPLSNWVQYVIYQIFHREIEVLLDQVKPHLIICTHPFSSSSVSRLKRLGYPLTLCTVITDFHVHSAWVHPEVDVYLVPSDEVKYQLINMGIQRNRIVITGIPIRSNFWTKKNKQEVRQKLKLKDLPTVMIMGGGLGLGGIYELANALLKWKEELQIVICTGNNEKLKRSLTQDEKFQHPNVHILGFVEMVDEWMEASDLLITKPGGLTCFEALFKGVPMLLYQPIPGHEEKNCDFLVNNHLAIRIDTQNEIDDWMQKLIFSPHEIKSIHDRIRQFQQNIDPMASAGFIIKFLIS